MATLDAQVDTFFRNLETVTGKPVDAWVALVLSGTARTHKAIRETLQTEHRMGYGYANAIANRVIEKRDGISSIDDLLEAHYSGKKAAMRPVYDALLERIEAFGNDVDVVPKKAYVSLRRSKQFGLIQPAVGRLDVGIALKGVAPEGTFEAAGSWNGMVSHRIRITGEADFPNALRWLREAYDRA